MNYWSFSLADDPTQPDHLTGYVRAETLDAARQILTDPALNLYPLPDDFIWPGDKEHNLYIAQDDSPPHAP